MAGLPVVVVPLRFNVTPGIAPVTVLLALLMGIPSTVSEAFAAVLARVMSKVESESLTVKSAAEPVVELMSASREPLESVTMLAFTPMPEALIALARSESEFTPDPVVKEVCVPSAPVMVSVEVPRLEVLLGSEGEYHDAVVARLWTFIVCVPAVAPEAAVPATCELVEETERAASGPLRSFRLFRSVETDDRAVWMDCSAEYCDERVDCSDCHCRSGARSA